MANPFAAIPPHQGNVADESKGVSPKVTGATLGGALATVLWTLLAGYDVLGLKTSLGADGITAITGATGTVFAFVLGYLFPDPARTATN